MECDILECSSAATVSPVSNPIFTIAARRRFSLKWQLHWVYLVLCIFVLIALMGLAIEDNSSSFGGIPREEYIRVVGGILNTEPGAIHEHMHAQASKKLERTAVNSDRQRQRYAEKVRMGLG